MPHRNPDLLITEYVLYSVHILPIISWEGQGLIQHSTYLSFESLLMIHNRVIYLEALHCERWDVFLTTLQLVDNDLHCRLGWRPEKGLLDIRIVD